MTLLRLWSTEAHFILYDREVVDQQQERSVISQVPSTMLCTSARQPYRCIGEWVRTGVNLFAASSVPTNLPRSPNDRSRVSCE